MADLNRTYNGYIEKFDAWIPYEVCNGLRISGACIGSWETKNAVDDFPEQYKEYKESIEKFNADSSGTVAGVKVEYTTDKNRIDWLLERIKAVDLRANFIQDRISVLKTGIVANGGNVADNVAGDLILSIGAAVIPVIGPAVKKILDGVIKSDKAETVAYLQEIYAKYVQDLTGLSEIKKQLKDEYAKAGNTPGPTTPAPTPGPTQEAPNPNAKYYWIGGALVLILFLYWQSRRKKR